MRLHDFECKECGHIFEELVESEDEEVECPLCVSTNTKRRLSGFHAQTGGVSSSSGGGSASHGGFG